MLVALTPTFLFALFPSSFVSVSAGAPLFLRTQGMGGSEEGREVGPEDKWKMDSIFAVSGNGARESPLSKGRA